MTADILDEPDGRDDLPEHSLLGSYRLVQRLGEGGMEDTVCRVPEWALSEPPR
jgi:hypothetical protein